MNKYNRIIAAIAALLQDALPILEAHYQRTGVRPGDTPIGDIRMALRDYTQISGNVCFASQTPHDTRHGKWSYDDAYSRIVLEEAPGQAIAFPLSEHIRNSPSWQAAVRRLVASANSLSFAPVGALEVGVFPEMIRLFVEMEDYLREIRSENLDGSEQALAGILEIAREVRLTLQLGEQSVEHADAPFIGESHPRYQAWREEVSQGNTLLGLVDWIEHNPVDELDDPDTLRDVIAELEAERAEIADGISDTCDSEYDREGRDNLAAWDAVHGQRLAELKARLG